MKRDTKDGGKGPRGRRIIKTEAADAARAESKRAPGGEEAQMPGHTDWFRKARTFIDRAPDVRAELVTGIKADIASGGYKVDAWKVAEKMIERAVRNALHTRE